MALGIILAIAALVGLTIKQTMSPQKSVGGLTLYKIELTLTFITEAVLTREI